MIIREVRRDELSILLQIARDTFVNTYEALNNPEDFREYVDTHFSIAEISKEYDTPGSNFYFATIKKEIVGYTKLNINTAQSEDVKDALEIERIYVLPSLKGNGIGKSLIHHSVSQAREAQKKKVWLGVWEKNPAAIAFYKKQGFASFGTHTFTIGSDVQTDYMMELIVDR